MHRDSLQGVVDANARVHGVANLFVAGGSVFPTSGFVNPTLTIVALALRLSAHLHHDVMR
jgi:choline dehydrogenase-like flavoprotein